MFLQHSLLLFPVSLLLSLLRYLFPFLLFVCNEHGFVELLSSLRKQKLLPTDVCKLLLLLRLYPLLLYSFFFFFGLLLS
jgi:hypothetical protein